MSEGAYYAPHLLQAKNEGRIGEIYKDPLMGIKTYWDIGGTGAKADACAIWVVQWIGERINVIDYYEAQGQPLATHINWLRSRGYEHALCVLPHDGVKNDAVFDVNYAGFLKSAGFDVQVVPNQGAGAASQRIEALRRIFHRMWFDKDRTEAGREALGAYHEKRDDERGIGLGPEHDWSSHGADALGMMGVVYEEPRQKISRAPRRNSSPWAA